MRNALIAAKLTALISIGSFAQNTQELKSKIKSRDMDGAFKSFVSGKRGSSSGLRESSFRASLHERIGNYHLAIHERAIAAQSRRERTNDGKLGNLSLLVGRHQPVLKLGFRRAASGPTELKAAFAAGLLLERGNASQAARALPGVNALSSMSHSAPAYKAMTSAAGIHLARGRYNSAITLLSREFRQTPNFDLGFVRLQRARLLFDARRYSQALDELVYLPKTSSSWYQGSMVGAWSAYYLKDYNLALGILMNLHSPYLATKFNPESFLLESAVLYRLCYFESAARSIKKLRSRYSTLPRSIKRFEGLARSPVQLMNILNGYSRGRRAAQRGIPQNDWDLIVDGLLTEQVIADIDKSLSLVAQEKSWVQSSLSSSQFSRLRSRYLRELNDANREYYKRVARVSRLHLGKMYRDTVESLEGALAVEVEVNTRVRDRLLTKKVPQRKEIDFDREIKKGFEFWPFEGEFWRDETGSYAFATSDVCGVRTR